MPDPKVLPPGFSLKPVAAGEKSSAGLPRDGSGGLLLRRKGRIVKTPAGHPFVHSSAPLLAAVAAELATEWPPDVTMLSLYSLYCTMLDFVPHAAQANRGSLESLIYGDLSLATCAGPEGGRQLARTSALNDYFESNDLVRLTLGQFGDWETNKECFGDEHGTQVVDHFVAIWRKLSDAEKSAVTNTVHTNGVFVLGFLLATGRCTPEEYATAVMAVQCVDPDIFADVNAREATAAKKNLILDATLIRRFVELAETRSTKASVEIDCPWCTETLEAEDGEVGDAYACAVCGKTFYLA